MNASSQFPPLKLHRGYVRPLPFEHMAHHDPDAVYSGNLRDGVPHDERKADNTRRWNERHISPPPAELIAERDRIDAELNRTNPYRMGLAELVACAAVMAFICAMLAMGGAF